MTYKESRGFQSPSVRFMRESDVHRRQIVLLDRIDHTRDQRGSNGVCIVAGTRQNPWARHR